MCWKLRTAVAYMVRMDKGIACEIVTKNIV